MKILTIIDINGQGTDLALVLNDDIIMTVDTQSGGSSEELHSVANNLIRALSLETVITTNYTADRDDWNWSEILAEYLSLRIKKEEYGHKNGTEDH